MNRELDKLLCERYPSLFRDRDAPMTDTVAGDNLPGRPG